MTTTQLVLLLFAIDILIHLIVSIAVGVYLHAKAKSASVEIGNGILQMVPAISGALAEQVADKVVEKMDDPNRYLPTWQSERSVIG